MIELNTEETKQLLDYLAGSRSDKPLSEGYTLLNNIVAKIQANKEKEIKANGDNTDSKKQ